MSTYDPSDEHDALMDTILDAIGQYRSNTGPPSDEAGHLAALSNALEIMAQPDPSDAQLQETVGGVFGSALAVVAISGGQIPEQQDLLTRLANSGFDYAPEDYEDSTDDDPFWLFAEVGTGAAGGDPVDTARLIELAGAAQRCVGPQTSVGLYFTVGRGIRTGDDIEGAPIAEAIERAEDAIGGRVVFGEAALTRLKRAGWEAQPSETTHAATEIVTPLGAIVLLGSLPTHSLDELALMTALAPFQRRADTQGNKTSTEQPFRTYDGVKLKLHIPTGYLAYPLLLNDDRLELLNKGQPLGEIAEHPQPVDFTYEVPAKGGQQRPVILLSDRPLPALHDIMRVANEAAVATRELRLAALQDAASVRHPEGSFALAHSRLDFVREN